MFTLIFFVFTGADQLSAGRPTNIPIEMTFLDDLLSRRWRPTRIRERRRRAVEKKHNLCNRFAVCIELEGETIENRQRERGGEQNDFKGSSSVLVVRARIGKHRMRFLSVGDVEQISAKLEVRFLRNTTCQTSLSKIGKRFESMQKGYWWCDDFFCFHRITDNFSRSIRIALHSSAKLIVISNSFKKNMFDLVWICTTPSTNKISMRCSLIYMIRLDHQSPYR